MSTLSIREKETFEKFKIAVADLNQPAITLLRFLHARNFDVARAEQMLRNYLEFRKINDIDNCGSWKVAEDIDASTPGGFTGLDYNKHHVCYVPAGIYPIRQLIEAGRETELTRVIYKKFGSVISEVEKSPDQKYTNIVDLAELKFWTVLHYPTLQFMLKRLREFENHHPNTLQELIIINAPTAFHWIYPYLKPIITGTTLSRIAVFGSDEKEYMPEILKRMPVSSLPIKLQILAKTVSDKL